MQDFFNEKSTTGIRLSKFGAALRAAPPSLSRAKQLIFLCGANRPGGGPSARRQALKKFILSVSNVYSVIYAEGIFNELQKLGHKKNVLDLEHEISDIADRVVIVLESESAFCELGAFAHAALRQKLIVVNDSNFRQSQSFINTGPLAAVDEAKSPILWYPMSPSGIHTLDGIGATFPELKTALQFKPPPSEPITHNSLSQLGMNKISLYFIHDLVYFLGPINHKELVQTLEFLFGNQNFDPLKNLLGVLREGRLIHTKQVQEKEWVYRPISPEPFLKYRENTSGLLSSFRTYHLKNNPTRFDHA